MINMVIGEVLRYLPMQLITNYLYEEDFHGDMEKIIIHTILKIDIIHGFKYTF